jgi:small-conductance mechanosensitive channel
MHSAILTWICTAVGFSGFSHRKTMGRFDIRVGVSYRADPDRVREILETVARECPLILQDPAPSVGFDDFGASALEFSLSAAVADVSRSGAAQTDLRTRILKAFRAAGIEMPYAQHDIHLRDLDAVRAILNRVAEERSVRSSGAGESESRAARTLREKGGPAQ